MSAYTSSSLICLFICVCSGIVAEHYIWGSYKPKEELPIENTLLTEMKSVKSSRAVRDPLILTPYINDGKIQRARNLSRVIPKIQNWSSYSGYLTVNPDCGSHLFFWFLPAKNNWRSAPVLLWLQGGPGAGSLYGLFEEIGPFNHFPSGLKERNYTWNTDNNVIYIDQPVGSGYSYSEKKCFAENMTAVTQELYTALIQFFKMFPELQKNQFFLTGESFAGHYIPAVGLHIHENNPNAEVQMNLAGIFVGNPLTKLSCHDYASFLYEWGVVGVTLRDQIAQRQEMLKNNTEAGQYKDAWDDWDYILNNLILEKTYLPNRECMVDQPSEQGDYIAWVTTPTVRQQLHVGDTEYNDINLDVYNKLVRTIAEPFTSEIEKLLEARKYSVGFYSGNLDMICMTASTACVLEDLQWWGAEDYRQNQRKPFSVNGETLAGWVKMAGPLYFVVIKDSGHSVPSYQPNVTFTLITKATTAPPGVNPASLLDM